MIDPLADPIASHFPSRRKYYGKYVTNSNGGNYSLADDYATFDQKRSEHLKNVFYSRIRDQAVNVLQETVATREYPTYTSCLQKLNSPSPTFSIWATRETLDEIDIAIRYVGATDIEVTPTATVEGGTVAGSPVGFLWNKPPIWSR